MRGIRLRNVEARFEVACAQTYNPHNPGHMGIISTRNPLHWLTIGQLRPGSQPYGGNRVVQCLNIALACSSSERNADRTLAHIHRKQSATLVPILLFTPRGSCRAGRASYSSNQEAHDIGDRRVRRDAVPFSSRYLYQNTPGTQRKHQSRRPPTDAVLLFHAAWTA